MVLDWNLKSTLRESEYRGAGERQCVRFRTLHAGKQPVLILVYEDHSPELLVCPLGTGVCFMWRALNPGFVCWVGRVLRWTLEVIAPPPRKEVKQELKPGWPIILSISEISCKLVPLHNCMYRSHTLRFHISVRRLWVPHDWLGSQGCCFGYSTTTQVKVQGFDSCWDHPS